eukprot:11371-Heterococcus_DN1.PRE.2
MVDTRSSVVTVEQRHRAHGVYACVFTSPSCTHSDQAILRVSNGTRCATHARAPIDTKVQSQRLAEASNKCNTACIYKSIERGCNPTECYSTPFTIAQRHKLLMYKAAVYMLDSLPGTAAAGCERG